MFVSRKSIIYNKCIEYFNGTKITCSRLPTFVVKTSLSLRLLLVTSGWGCSGGDAIGVAVGVGSLGRGSPGTMPSIDVDDKDVATDSTRLGTVSMSSRRLTGRGGSGGVGSFGSGNTVSVTRSVGE